MDFRGGTVFAGRLKDDEERGLTKTSDGKPGFRELLGEDNQKARLTPTSVDWENKPIRGITSGRRVASRCPQHVHLLDHLRT